MTLSKNSGDADGDNVEVHRGDGIHASYKLDVPSASKKLRNADTLQGTNISHLGKRKIIFKTPFLGDMLVPWRVYPISFHKLIGVL